MRTDLFPAFNLLIFAFVQLYFLHFIHQEMMRVCVQCAFSSSPITIFVTALTFFSTFPQSAMIFILI